jgi:hypothetical protein
MDNRKMGKIIYKHKEIIYKEILIFHPIDKYKIRKL